VLRKSARHRQLTGDYQLQGGKWAKDNKKIDPKEEMDYR